MPPTVRRFAATLGAAALAVALGVIVLSNQLGAVLASATESTTAPSTVELDALAQRSIVYDRNGNVLAVLHAEENRSPVPLSAVPKHVIDAVLAVEDSEFYSHGGVNLRATMRALFTNVQVGDVRQGGSTITQQLVKNTLLSPEQNLERKVKEAVYAVRLEDQMSKEQILEHYLNTVYFGSGAYGVQAAAETYFGTEVGLLTPGQAALLAGIIRNPVGYDPTRYPDAARARRAFALDRMVSEGTLSPEDAARYKDEPVPAERLRPPLTANDFVIEEVKQQLLEDRRLGETPQERYNAVFKGGLRIYASIDQRMQRAAEAAVAAGVPERWKGRFTGSLLSLDPRTGEVRAMVAGDDFAAEQTNLATGRGGSGRQPGSSFKPIVLAAAFEEGYGPNDIVDGRQPCRTYDPGRTDKWYDPGNYEGSSGSVTTLERATAQSLNCAYIRLGLAVGHEKVIAMARKLGIAGELKPIDSMPLGSQEVTPLEMAAAYATFAADGIYRKPTFVQKVEDASGRVLFEHDPKGERRLSPQTARMVNRVLRTVVTSGTGTRARLSGRPVAGKTGTSNEAQNVWFVGYTRQLSTAVWLGAPKGNISMGRATGGTYAAPIWRQYTAAALEGAEVLDFPDPDPKLIPRAKRVKEADTLRGPSPTRKRATGTVDRPRRTTRTTVETTPTTASAPAPAPAPAPPPAEQPREEPRQEKPKPAPTTTTTAPSGTGEDGSE